MKKDREEGSLERKVMRELKQRKLSQEHLRVLIGEIKNPTKADRKAHHLPMKGSEIVYGVYGDRHVGSIFYDHAAVMRYAEEASKWGVQFMVDCGDSVDGSFNMHRGMWREQSHRGFDDQLKELVEKTPDLGVPVYHINGNHDYSWLKTEGVNLGVHYEKNHKDVRHLGTSNAFLEVGKTNIQLLHPGGGGSYALSYRLQKIIESFEGGTKPHILHVNHFHKMAQVFYRNVHAFLDGCFQSQTHFMMEQGLAAHKGSWLVRVHPDKFGGVADLETKFVPFYK